MPSNATPSATRQEASASVRSGSQCQEQLRSRNVVYPSLHHRLLFSASESIAEPAQSQPKQRQNDASCILTCLRSGVGCLLLLWLYSQSHHLSSPPSSASLLDSYDSDHDPPNAERMSTEGLVKNGRKNVVIIGGGAAGMVCLKACLYIHTDSPTVMRRHPLQTPGQIQSHYHRAHVRCRRSSHLYPSRQRQVWDLVDE